MTKFTNYVKIPMKDCTERKLSAREKAELTFEEFMRNKDSFNRVKEISLDGYFDAISSFGFVGLGYGILPASILLDRRMRDPYLLATLGLVCSQAGANNKAIIARSTFCNALGITSHTFAKYMKKLCDYGYVRRYQPRPRKFETTEYSVNYDAMKADDDAWINLKRRSVDGVERKIGIKASSFANIPKIVMHDERLNVYDKAVYVVLLLIAGVGMKASVRRDFIAELTGIKNIDTVSVCTRHLVEAGYILTEYQYAVGRTSTTYHMLVAPESPESFNYCPTSWLKHDLLRIFQSPDFPKYFDDDDMEIAAKSIFKRNLDYKFNTLDIKGKEVDQQSQLFDERYLEQMRELNKQAKAKIKEENRVKVESERAKNELIEKMKAEGKTAEEIFKAMAEKVGAVPYGVLDGNTLYACKGRAVVNGDSDEDNYIADIIGSFHKLSRKGKQYVLSIIGGVPTELRNNSKARQDASRYATELLNGLKVNDDLDKLMANEIHKTLLDGINHPSRLGYKGKKMDGNAFCARINELLLRGEDVIVKKAQEAMERTREKFNDFAGDVLAYKAYLRAVFLNKLFDWRPAWA